MDQSSAIQKFTDFWKQPFQISLQPENRTDGQIPCISDISIENIKAKPSLYRFEQSHLFTSVVTQAQNKFDIPIYDSKDQIVTGININKVTNSIDLPFNLNSAIQNLITEQYFHNEKGQSAIAVSRELYYAIKPILPRILQIALRRQLASKIMSRRSFPNWPIDTSVDEVYRLLMRLVLSQVTSKSLPILSFWPREADFSFVITHDVEQQSGFDNIMLMAEIERKHGFRSAWNIVPERYQVDLSMLKELESEGFEVGIHGLNHDGKLFQSLEMFLYRASRINTYLRKWKSVGFRSPSAIRKLDWIGEFIDAEYDSSCPTSELFGAQPGGCCTAFPFIHGNVVELPISLQEDHTLLEILNLTPNQMLETWLQAIRKIKKIHGLALMIVHPDYMLTPERLKAYDKFLQIMKMEQNCWHAIPREVAQWWRDRQESNIILNNDVMIIHGPASGSASIVETKLCGSELIIKH